MTRPAGPSPPSIPSAGARDHRGCRACPAASPPGSRLLHPQRHRPARERSSPPAQPGWSVGPSAADGEHAGDCDGRAMRARCGRRAGGARRGEARRRRRRGRGCAERTTDAAQRRAHRRDREGGPLLGPAARVVYERRAAHEPAAGHDRQAVGDRLDARARAGKPGGWPCHEHEVMRSTSVGKYKHCMRHNRYTIDADAGPAAQRSPGCWFRDRCRKGAWRAARQLGVARLAHWPKPGAGMPAHGRRCVLRLGCRLLHAGCCTLHVAGRAVAHYQQARRPRRSAAHRARCRRPRGSQPAAKRDGACDGAMRDRTAAPRHAPSRRRFARRMRPETKAVRATACVRQAIGRCGVERRQGMPCHGRAGQGRARAKA